MFAQHMLRSLPHLTSSPSLHHLLSQLHRIQKSLLAMLGGLAKCVSALASPALDVERPFKRLGKELERQVHNAKADKAVKHVGKQLEKAGKRLEEGVNREISNAKKLNLGAELRKASEQLRREADKVVKDVGKQLEKAGKRLEKDVNREIRNAKKLNLGAELCKASEQLRKEADKAAKDLGKQLEKEAKRLASEAVLEKLKSALMNTVPGLKAVKAAAIVAGMAKARKHVKRLEQLIKKLQAGVKKKGVALVDFLSSEAVGLVAGMRKELKAATSVFIKGAVAELANCKSIAKKVADGGDKLLGALHRTLEKIKTTVEDMKRTVDEGKRKVSKIKLGDDIVNAMKANAQRAVTDVLRKGLTEIVTDFVKDIIIAAAL